MNRTAAKVLVGLLIVIVALLAATVWLVHRRAA